LVLNVRIKPVERRRNGSAIPIGRSVDDCSNDFVRVKCGCGKKTGEEFISVLDNKLSVLKS